MSRYITFWMGALLGYLVAIFIHNHGVRMTEPEINFMLYTYGAVLLGGFILEFIIEGIETRKKKKRGAMIIDATGMDEEFYRQFPEIKEAKESLTDKQEKR